MTSLMAAFCWAVTAVPLAASPEGRGAIPGRDPLPAVSAGTDGRELFDGVRAGGPAAPADPAVDSSSGSGADLDQGLKSAGGRHGRQEGPLVGATAVPAPAAVAGGRPEGSEKGFCNGSFREFDQKVGKIPVLREILSIILQPVVIYCTLTN